MLPHRLGYSVLRSNIKPQTLPCSDWPRGNMVSVPHFLSDVPHAYLKKNEEVPTQLDNNLKPGIIK